MEQLTFLDELHDLRGARKSARRARRSPREGRPPCGSEHDQRAFDFERAAVVRGARVYALPSAGRDRDADAWYLLGCELESADSERARAAYERALELAPAHPDAHTNLGCLEHEAGRPAAAEQHYRAAI